MREGLLEKVTLELKQNKTKTLTGGRKGGGREEGGWAPWRIMWGKSSPGSRYRGPEAGACQIVPEIERGLVWLEQRE